MNTDYFVRFVKDWNESDEKYGDVQYKIWDKPRSKPLSRMIRNQFSLHADIELKNLESVNGWKSYPVSEIVSFRGRFCEQAKSGEPVEAQGKVEKVTHLKTNQTHFRLLIGNNFSDYMVPV